MGKYGDVLNLWKFEMNGVAIELKPRKGDNYRLAEIMATARKNGNEALMLKDFGNFLKSMIERDCPPANDQEREELDMAIEFNITKLLEETLVKFRWTTKEDYQKIQSKVGNA